MSDSPDDKPAPTPPVNEQDSPPAETEIDPSPLTPPDPVAAVETDSDPVPSTPTQPVTAVEGAEGRVPDDEPARQPPQDAVDPAGQDQEAPPAAVQEVPVAPVATPEPVTPEPGTATPAAPEAPRPVFDPAPPPPRNDAPAEAPETTAATAPRPESVVDPTAGDEAVAEPLDEEAQPASSPRSALARRWPLVLLPLVVIAVVVAAFAVKSNTDKAVDKVKTTAAFVTFTDKEKGFSIKYPGKWTRAGRPDNELRLLVKDEGLDSLLVRVVPTPAPFPADLTGEEAKQVADVVLKRETFAPERILREQPVNVNGAPGYYYLYTFDEEVKGEGPPQKVQGVHAHYIVFSGRRVFILVFQALPTANFDKLAATFDAMAESFKITPLASDAPDPTTAPDPAVPPTEPAPAPAPSDTSVPAPAGR
ncbi:MAG TPA: hypothetical protein VM142_00125 [Acidimicrobiales bacterium]|nr:hypothetical protein [Acidimicrobiales bacterium]